MRYMTVLVVGLLVLVLGAQGAIRLLADHDNSGFLSWMPGGFPVRLLAYVVLVGVGALLAEWGSRKSKQAEARRS
ncbi:hypothetical protein [Rhodococcus sp. UNC363MFTsu5.1]|uniref:hypothetical protein n=1 Tax=Rhodococcus sp. UNC363MFTsu5.1 TaxID=1449069 RepID=UPI000483422C|nr:hypothetical protein [Rhodococcus sp. UNC363MFTsu5.1]